MANCSAIAKFYQQKKAYFKAKYGARKKSLAFLFEEINALKRKLKPENTASSMKRKAESLLNTEINLTASHYEDASVRSRITCLLLLNHLALARLS
jgi:phosphopantetheinyl transferase (holo-ACP synthase)